MRQANLTYHGPAADLTHLTEFRIGWFGPTNADDPLHGDLWFAANLAVQDANAPVPPSDAGCQMPGAGCRMPDARCPMPDLRSPISDLRSPISDLRPPPSALRPPFRLLARWAVDPWGTGVALLTRMVFEEQPLALLGSVDSASTHLAEQVVAKANLPLVSPVATDGTATLAGVPWMFACAPSDQAVAAALVQAVLEQNDVTPGRLAMLIATDHASRMTAAAVRQEFSRRGRLPDFQFQVTAGATDLTRHVAALVEARPKTILIIAGAEDAARWVTHVRAALPEVVLFGGPELRRRRFRELVGALADEVRVPELVQRDPTNPEWIRFCARFQAKRGYPPDDAAVLTYDATRLLLEAVRRAGPNRARIREMLLSLSPWPGLGGEIRFDGTGQNVRAGLLVRPPSPHPSPVGRERVPEPSAALQAPSPIGWERDGVRAGSFPVGVRTPRELVPAPAFSDESNP